jgi:serine/threonine protein kinase
MDSLRDEWEKKLQDSNATPMRLPLEFLKAITRDFSSELELGRGGYGVVYKVCPLFYSSFQMLESVIIQRYMYLCEERFKLTQGVLRSGKVIAVKKFYDIHLVDDKNFQNEVRYLMEIKHQHVVQFIGYCAESSWELMPQPSGNFIWAEIPKRLLCFEYLCNKSISEYISGMITKQCT